jgi:hypothetical protein
MAGKTIWYLDICYSTNEFFYVAVFITFALIMLADKYRYRSPSTLSTRRLSKRPGTVEPYNEPVIIERANPGNWKNDFKLIIIRNLLGFLVFINDDSLTMSSQKRTLSLRSSSNSNTTDLRVERLWITQRLSDALICTIDLSLKYIFYHL